MSYIHIAQGLILKLTQTSHTCETNGLTGGTIPYSWRSVYVGIPSSKQAQSYDYPNVCDKVYGKYKFKRPMPKHKKAKQNNKTRIVYICLNVLHLLTNTCPVFPRSVVCSDINAIPWQAVSYRLRKTPRTQCKCWFFQNINEVKDEIKTQRYALTITEKPNPKTLLAQLTFWYCCPL